ncbi:MAG: hypothetical protein WAZ77_03345 [Candidatus Nitrosopolaris sp.]|jgi:hypothetical protein
MFDGLTRKFQFRFKARVSAGNIIGEALKDTIKLADYLDYQERLLARVSVSRFLMRGVEL